MTPNEDPDNHDVPYDAGEDYDAADEGEVVVTLAESNRLFLAACAAAKDAGL